MQTSILNCAAIIADADWSKTVIIKACVSFVKDKILPVEDVRKSDVTGADIATRDNVVLAAGNHCC